MENRKIAFFMKSNFTFNRFKTLCNSAKGLRTLDVYPNNLSTYNEVDDLLEFWEPDLVIVDTKLEEIERIESLLINQNIRFFRFTSDFDYIVEQIMIYFNIQDEDENDDEDEDKTDGNINYIKKEETKNEVIVKEKIIEKEIIKREYTSVRNKLVAVASLWAGAGSTTFAINLARAIAERGLEVSYIEYPLAKPYMFDYLNISNKEDMDKGYVYKDLVQQIKREGRKINHTPWKENGINWYVTDTRIEPVTDFSFEEMLRLVYSVNSIVTIIDLSHHLYKQTVQEFLHQVDEVFICIEPNPIKIDWLSTIYYNGKAMPNQRPEQKIMKFLQSLETEENIKYQFILMKDLSFKEKRDFLDCLEKEPLCYFPVIPYNDLLLSVWHSKFLYDNENYTDLIEKAVKPAIVKLLPREFYDLKKSKSNSIFNILKRRG